MKFKPVKPLLLASPFLYMGVTIPAFPSIMWLPASAVHGELKEANNGEDMRNFHRSMKAFDNLSTMQKFIAVVCNKIQEYRKWVIRYEIQRTI